MVVTLASWCCVVVCGGDLRIVVVHCCPWWWPSHRGGTSLSVVVTLASWWCVVVHGGGPHIMVVRRCPWLWPCSSVFCFVLVSCGRGPLSPLFVRARSGEERAVYSPGLRFCNVKRMLRLSLTLITPACCRALPPCS